MFFSLPRLRTCFYFNRDRYQRENESFICNRFIPEVHSCPNHLKESTVHQTIKECARFFFFMELKALGDAILPCVLQVTTRLSVCLSVWEEEQWTEKDKGFLVYQYCCIWSILLPPRLSAAPHPLEMCIQSCVNSMVKQHMQSCNTSKWTIHLYTQISLFPYKESIPLGFPWNPLTGADIWRYLICLGSCGTGVNVMTAAQHQVNQNNLLQLWYNLIYTNNPLECNHAWHVLSQLYVLILGGHWSSEKPSRTAELSREQSSNA